MENNCEEYVLGLSLPNDKPQALKFITKVYLDQLDPDEYHVPEKIASELIGLIRNEFKAYNENALPRAKWQIPDGLTPELITMVMLHLHNIKTINYADLGNNKEYDMLAIYQENGENAGIYTSDETELRNLVRRYNFSLNSNNVTEVINRLKDMAERASICEDKDLIALNNGIFNYKTKILEPFSPDLIFTAKSHVNYNPAAQNINIHNNEDNTDWNVVSWIEQMFPSGSDIPNLIWQLLGAVLRPNVKWHKAAFLYATSGNNGKGCICQLMRNLAGDGSHVSIPLSDFGKDFMLEQLIGKTSIITDENDVGTYIDKVGNLKAIITNDVISINRKFKKPITYRFRGFMVQCINQLPKINDRSDSVYRRQLFVPFEKCYTGAERKYIKNDYINRQEVLEYVLYKVMHTNYYELDEPKESKFELEYYKVLNNPVLDFLKEILSEFSWDALSNTLLYDCFKSWTSKNNPNGKVQGKNMFLEEVRNVVGQGMCGWSYFREPKFVPVIAQWSHYDPFLNRYGIDWHYYLVTPTIKGLLRDQPKGDPNDGKEEEAGVYCDL